MLRLLFANGLSLNGQRRIDTAARRICCSTAPWMGVSGPYVQARSRASGRTSTIRCAPKKRCDKHSTSLPGRLALPSLAELSASIAHEVNQPLAAIVANSHACQRWLSAEPANVERAKITAERITRDANQFQVRDPREYADARYRAHPSADFSNRQKRPRPQR